MAYWLLKSEPTVFSIDTLAGMPQQMTAWDGVRNYQARNYLQSMQCNDQAFFYHSSCETPSIVGIVKIVKTAYPELPQDPRQDSIIARCWFCVDIVLIQQFSQGIALASLKKANLPALKNMILLKKGNRLSVMPVSPLEWQTVMQWVK